jgi:glutamate--cysteine ligase
MERGARSGEGAARGAGGFSLVEVMITLVIGAIGLLALFLRRSFIGRAIAAAEATGRTPPAAWAQVRDALYLPVRADHVIAAHDDFRIDEPKGATPSPLAGLFPGGFDNLSETTLPLAVQAAMAAIEKYCPDARNLLLLPDASRRAPAYLASVQRLAAILRQTGLNVRFGCAEPALSAPLRLDLPDGSAITLEPLRRQGRRVGLADFDPCSILLNDELPGGTPEILEGLHEQVLLPPLHAGWGVRRKSQHAAAYRDVARRFAKLLDVDPWLITPLHSGGLQAAFGTREGEDSLAGAVDALLRQMRTKYREYGVRSAPFVVVKPDAGPSGGGVVTVRDAAELRRLGLRERDRIAGAGEGRVRAM